MLLLLLQTELLLPLVLDLLLLVDLVHWRALFARRHIFLNDVKEVTFRARLQVLNLPQQL